MSRPIPHELLTLVERAVGEVASDQRLPLTEQLRQAVVVDEAPGRRLDLDVPTGCAPVPAPNGPLRPAPAVVSTDGDLLGELTVWVDEGRLSAVEHSWYTDEAPSTWPDAAALSFDD